MNAAHLFAFEATITYGIFPDDRAVAKSIGTAAQGFSKNRTTYTCVRSCLGLRYNLILLGLCLLIMRGTYWRLHEWNHG